MEREISFRTESGLYYSYYKQLVNTPSFVQGTYTLAATHSINIYVCVELKMFLAKYVKVYLYHLYTNGIYDFALS